MIYGDQKTIWESENASSFIISAAFKNLEITAVSIIGIKVRNERHLSGCKYVYDCENDTILKGIPHRLRRR